MPEILNTQVIVKSKFVAGFYLIFILFQLSPQICLSQRYNFKTYNTTNGMPGNQVNSIIQDSYSRLWVGTMNGVTVFDGTNFTRFENNNPISTNPVKSLFEDSKGNIWIGMIRKGLCKFSGTTYEYYNTANGLLSDNVNAITEDSRGHIWIGTSEGLNRFDGKTMHSYTSLRGLVNNNIFDLKFDSKGQLWISTLDGISVFDGRNFTNYTTDAGLLSNICYKILEDRQGKIWISTYLGISVFDGTNFRNYTTSNGLLTDRIEEIIETKDNKKMFASYGGGIGVIDGENINYITVDQGLPSNIVKTLIQDIEGNYWFGTWNGLCKYDGDRFINYTHEDGLTNNNILSIAADSSGRVFFGTLTGGVNYTDGTSIQTLGTESGLKGSTIWSIYIKNDQNYWFGTTNGPALLDINTWTFTHPFPELENMIIYSILEDSRGRLMFGTDKGIYIRNVNGEFEIIGNEQGLANDKVRVLFEDSEKRIWIGTLKNINYFEDDKIINFNEKFNIPSAPVTSIIQDTTGRILVSTYDFGIFVISKSANASIISHINKSMGLYNDRLLFNFLDKNQKLWLGTPSGLDCFSWRNYINTGKITIEHFDKSNGYPGVETNAACSDVNGNIWFASVNGIIKHNTRSETILLTIPNLRISGVELFLKNIDWRRKQIPVNVKTGLPEDMVLSYDNNHIKISYSGIYLTAPEVVKYQHMLDGFEDQWSPISSQDFANYSNLSSGEYTFKVKCTANGRDWSNTITYSFVIKPPYWKTPFFYFLYFLAASSSIFLFLKFRTRNLQKTQIMLRQKVEQRTRELNMKNLELEKLSIVASETDNTVLIFDKNKEIEWANAAYSKMTGYTVEEIRNTRGRHIRDFTFNQEVSKLVDDCITYKKSAVFESQVTCKDGSRIWTSNMLTPIFDEQGELKKIVVINTDITYRKMMEEKIKESLEEKGLLLREIHHRVKNNLQIIISLFNLQSHYVDDQKAFEALKEGQDRIKSMALIHERFYQNEGLSRIDFDDYIKRLIENLFLSFNISPDRISYVIDAEKISLDIDTAVPCGLIINELVSNTLKHAFLENQKGELRVSFKRSGGETLTLTISDNGKGLPEGFVVETVDTLGMQLINALANQLDGKISVAPGGGTTFVLEFTPTHKAAEAMPVTSE